MFFNFQLSAEREAFGRRKDPGVIDTGPSAQLADFLEKGYSMTDRLSVLHYYFQVLSSPRSLLPKSNSLFVGNAAMECLSPGAKMSLIKHISKKKKKEEEVLREVCMCM